MVSRYKALHVVFADHLVPKSILSEDSSGILNEISDLSFFCEIRATTKKPELEALVAKGMTVAEIGIESFDSNTLASIGKGNSALHNIAVLKWSLELGFSAYWSWLIGFQGETHDSLSAQSQLVSKLSHLPPPLHVTRVRLERGSPMYSDPSQYGLRIVSPHEALLHTFPFCLDDMNKVSKYFEYECVNNEEIFRSSFKKLIKQVDAWKENWLPNQFYYLSGQDFIKVFDRRSNGRETTLTDLAHLVFQEIDSPQHVNAVHRKVKEFYPDAGFGDVLSCLEELEHLGISVRENERWLNLVPRGNIHRLNWERELRRFSLLQDRSKVPGVLRHDH